MSDAEEIGQDVVIMMAPPGSEDEDCGGAKGEVVVVSPDAAAWLQTP